MNTQDRAIPVRRPPSRQTELGQVRIAERPPPSPSAEDRVRRNIGDADEYAIPEGDGPALHRLAMAVDVRDLPQIVTEEGLPLFVAISIDLYRDLLALYGLLRRRAPEEDDRVAPNLS